MTMRTDGPMSPPQGRKAKPAAAVPHHQAMGHAIGNAMGSLPPQHVTIPADQFFQAQQDFVSGVPYAAKPTPGVRKAGR